MNELKIESRITQSDYTQVVYLLIYRKPLVLLISLMGLALIVLSLLYFLNIYTPTEKPPYISLLAGMLIMIVFPVSIYRIAKRNFNSGNLLHENIIYTFTNDTVFLQGDSFAMTMSWKKIYKVKNLNKWILFYRDKDHMNFMIKNTFNNTQQKEFNRIIKLNKIL